MAIWTYENVTPSPIANTTTQKGFADGVHKIYQITPNEGYVLHDKGYDEYADVDPETSEPIGELMLGYRRTTASCRCDYDFDENPNEYFAALEVEVFAGKTPEEI